MKLLSHLRAHWRNPLYGFCEWYVYGRQSNWVEVPTPVDLEPAPGPVGRRSRMTRQFSCAHMAASGPGLRSVRCGVCGPMRRVVA